MTRARDLSNLMGSGNFSSTTFTATAGQTAFTIAHTQGFVQVFMNGLLLDLTTDYTSNGSAITLTTAAAAGDEIEVVKYNTFSVGDAVPASGGTFTGSINASAGLTTPAGHVIQVAQSSDTTETLFSTSDWNATTLTCSITPKKTSSKLLVTVGTNVQGDTGNAEGVGCKLTRQIGGSGSYADADNINTSSYGCHSSASGYSGDYMAPSSVSFQVYDSPSFTSGQSLIYRLEIKGYNSSYPVAYNRGRDPGSDSLGRWQTASTITIQEIAQ